MDHTTSLAELDDEWSVAVGRQEGRQRRLGAVQHAAAMRARRCGRGGARRGDAGVESGSNMDAGTTAIQEEGESDDFLFLFPCR